MPRHQPNRTATRKPINPLTDQIRRVESLADALDTVEPAVESLERLRQLRDQVNRAIDVGIVRAKLEGEYWPSIAAALRVSPQAVQQRARALV